MKTVAIITGYNKASGKVTTSELEPLLQNKRCETIVADPFAEERGSIVFNKTLLTASSTKSFVETTEKALPEHVDILVGYSYGGAMAITQEKCEAKALVLLSPALAGETVVWRGVEKRLKNLSFILPAFKDMDSEEFQRSLFRKMETLKEKGVRIVYFLPCMERKVQDERVKYSPEILIKLKTLGEVHFISVKKHRDMIRDEKVLNLIIERLGI